MQRRTARRALFVLVIALAPAARAQTPERSAADAPSVQLSSSFYEGAGASSPDAFTFVLDGHTQPEPDTLSYGCSLGWVRLSQPGDGGAVVSSHVSNATLSAAYRFGGERLTLDVGGGVVMGLTHANPSPARRLERAALGHALAMQGVYDAWLWAPGRAGFMLPARLQHRHALGRWQGSATLEAAALFTVPSSEDQEDDVRHVGQVGAEYAVLPRPWLAAGGRVHFVWMPDAQLWKTQWSAAPFLAVMRGRWRLSGDVLVNLDEPFGFLGRGQRIWAASLRVGAWL